MSDIGWYLNEHAFLIALAGLLVCFLSIMNYQTGKRAGYAILCGISVFFSGLTLAYYTPFEHELAFVRSSHVEQTIKSASEDHPALYEITAIREQKDLNALYEFRQKWGSYAESEQIRGLYWQAKKANDTATMKELSHWLRYGIMPISKMDELDDQIAQKIITKPDDRGC